MEQAKFLYSGPKSAKCGSIFYFVVTRFDPALLNSMPALIAFVTKTMDSAVHTGDYTLVVDLSWSTLSAEGMQTVCANAKAFWAMFPRTYKKNLRQVVVLQPTKFYHVVYGLLKQVISKKAYRKFVEVYDWKQLAGVLGVSEESVLIPESSKHNVSKVYRVVKVNAYGSSSSRSTRCSTSTRTPRASTTRSSSPRSTRSPSPAPAASRSSCASRLTPRRRKRRKPSLAPSA